MAALMLPLTVVLDLVPGAAELVTAALSAMPRSMVALLRGSPVQGGTAQPGRAVGDRCTDGAATLPPMSPMIAPNPLK
ncbi:hypothetical protein [Streptomyces sp. NPDC015125]|uniref:hypothetical protein n=1 Tax=Streptomyces sp. NPDC015125 TaxID=3364938 RepID=UPI0036FF0DD9